MKAPSYVKRLVEIAKKLKPASSTGTRFHVSFLVKKRKAVGIGINRYNKTNVVCNRYIDKHNKFPTPYEANIHSEQDILAKFKGRSLKGFTLVNIRIDNNGCVNMSAPCANCAWHLSKLNLDKVIFSISEDNFGEL